MPSEVQNQRISTKEDVIMKQQKLWIGILFCSLFVWTGNAFAAGPISQRQVRQQQRIEQGVRNGNITHYELNQLKKGQRKVVRATQRARGDRHITLHEARRINRLQDRASHNIYRYKHNRAQQPRMTRRVQKRHNGYPAPAAYRHCRVERRTGRLINGLIVQPGFSVAWNIPLN
jgi:hypothetical protein